MSAVSLPSGAAPVDRQRTVLIFAYECAPYHKPESTIGAQRPAQFAKHLAAFGWRAIVLCCDVRARGVDEAPDVGAIVHDRLRETDPASPVIIPIPSLAHDGVIDRSWRAVQPRRGLLSPVRAVVRRALTGVKLATGDYSQAWQPCARAAASAIADSVDVDACVGCHSPDAGLFLARWFSAKYRVPWIADFRDPVLRPFNRFESAIYLPIVRQLLRTASFTINVTPVWSDTDQRLFDRPAAMIPNGYDEDEFLPESPPKNERFTVAYVGHVHRQMRLGVFLSGLAKFQRAVGTESARRIRFAYAGNDHRMVRHAAEQTGVSELVDTTAFVPREQALSMVRSADALLLLSLITSRSENPYLAHGLYPGKTFEYVGARRPVLCVPGDGGQLDELMTRTRIGAILPSEDAVADYLRNAVAVWSAQGRLPYAPSEAEVAQYSRRALTQRLAGLLDRAVGDGVGAAAGATASAH